MSAEVESKLELLVNAFRTNDRATANQLVMDLAVKTTNDPINIVNLVVITSDFCFHDVAIGLSSRAIEIATKTDACRLYLALAKAHGNTGDMNKARECMKQAHEYYRYCPDELKKYVSSTLESYTKAVM